MSGVWDFFNDGGWFTHSWMVHSKSLLPDCQRVVQQIGGFFVLVLISEEQDKEIKGASLSADDDIVVMAELDSPVHQR